MLLCNNVFYITLVWLILVLFIVIFITIFIYENIYENITGTVVIYSYVFIFYDMQTNSPSQWSFSWPGPIVTKSNQSIKKCFVLWPGKIDSGLCRQYLSSILREHMSSFKATRGGIPQFGPCLALYTCKRQNRQISMRENRQLRQYSLHQCQARCTHSLSSAILFLLQLLLLIPLVRLCLMLCNSWRVAGGALPPEGMSNNPKDVKCNACNTTSHNPLRG